MGRLGAAEFDVVLHAVLEEIHILKHHGDVPQQALAGEFPHVVSTDRYGTAVRIIEPGCQIADGALAGAGRSHDGGSGPLGRGEGHIMEHLPFAVSEGYMGQGHIKPLWDDLPPILIDEVRALQLLQPVQHRIRHRQDMGRIVDSFHAAKDGERE